MDYVPNTLRSLQAAFSKERCRFPPLMLKIFMYQLAKASCLPSELLPSPCFFTPDLPPDPSRLHRHGSAKQIRHADPLRLPPPPLQA